MSKDKVKISTKSVECFIDRMSSMLDDMLVSNNTMRIEHEKVCKEVEVQRSTIVKYRYAVGHCKYNLSSLLHDLKYDRKDDFDEEYFNGIYDGYLKAFKMIESAFEGIDDEEN